MYHKFMLILNLSTVSPDRISGTEPGSTRQDIDPQPPPAVLIKDRLAKGMILFIFAALVLLAGYIGYIRFDEVVAPNMPVFVCCVPSFIVAGALVFFGVARRWTLVRRLGPAQPPPQVRTPEGQYLHKAESGPELRGDGTKKHGAKKIRRREIVEPYEERDEDKEVENRILSTEEIRNKKRSVQAYLETLKEQYNEGLLMEDAYRSLRLKYSNELHALDLMEKKRTRRI